MCRNILLLSILLSLNNNVLSSFGGRLYGINRPSLTSSLVQISNNSSNYIHLLNLGRSSLSGPATAMRTVDNNNYIVTYRIFDSFGVPYYYILTIDVEKTPKLKTNVTINGPGSGSFWQISDDQKQVVGVRESTKAGVSLELATINPTNGQTKTLGYYPYGSYSLVMGFARQRRLYYNLINSNLFCGINVDTGKLDINIKVPNDYSIYGLVYDSMKDRLISLVYSSTVVENGWFIATIVIENNSTMKFERIGKSFIPMGEKYLWSTTYTLALKERQWLTLWASSDDSDNNILISFDIDSGDIIEKQIVNQSKYLNNLVYFD